MTDARLETDAQPRFETDIYATLYIATANAIQATQNVREATETITHMTQEASQILEGMKYNPDDERTAK